MTRLLITNKNVCQVIGMSWGGSHLHAQFLEFFLSLPHITTANSSSVWCSVITLVPNKTMTGCCQWRYLLEISGYYYQIR